MLNTKPIKKINNDNYENNIIHNHNMTNDNNMINDIKNLNLLNDNMINENKQIFIESSKQKELEKLITNANNSIKNDYKSASDNNYTYHHDNKQEMFEIKNEPDDRAEWNEESNSYIIYMNNQVDCIITNNDILNNILNNDNNNNNIKKYIFILSYNPISGVSEFNFINSVFTSNLDLIIKLQNFIYDTLNNENMNNDILLFFYYQLIIWLFKNISLFENHKLNDKLSKVYSSISYRFSSLILKNIIKIKDMYSSNSESIDQLLKIKNELIHKLDNMNNTLSTSNNTNSNNTSSNNTSSNNTNSDDTNSDNTNSDNTSSKNYVEDNILNKYNIVNKDGLQITNFNDLFTEENSDNSVNGYTEINDTIDDTISKRGDKTNISKIKDIENSSNNTNTKSYNMESILNNSKIYNIKI